MRGFYAVRSAYSSGLGRGLTHALCCRPFSVEDRARFQVSPCDICSEPSGTGTGFFPECLYFPLSSHERYIIIVHAPEGQMGEAWENGKHWTKSTFTCCMYWLEFY